MAHKVIRATDGEVAGQAIEVYGVTFKQNTERHARCPSLLIVPMLQLLQESCATVRIYDRKGVTRLSRFRRT
jgi:UDPglucose 6-dehydrogenase